MNIVVNVNNEKHMELKEKSPYVNAVKEFIKGTIHDSTFFSLSQEEQQAQALGTLRKHQLLSQVIPVLNVQKEA